jgi:hypothetical protein
MANTSISQGNLSKPAPRWYRRLKRAVYLLQAGGILTGALDRLDISPSDQLFIVACVTVGLEVLGALLANGEVYAPAEDTAPDQTAMGKNKE